jgi:hypothetical protein
MSHDDHHHRHSDEQADCLSLLGYHYQIVNLMKCLMDWNWMFWALGKDWVNKWVFLFFVFLIFVVQRLFKPPLSPQPQKKSQRKK